MPEKKLFTGWCVAIKTKRGTWWSAKQYTGRTRTAAIAAYCKGCGTTFTAHFRKEYARDVRLGTVKCVRFTVTAVLDA